LIPTVIDELKRAGKLTEYIYFHKLVSDGKFPLDNLAFLAGLNRLVSAQPSFFKLLFQLKKILNYLRCYILSFVLSVT
jgi:hypothetical protein